MYCVARQSKLLTKFSGKYFQPNVSRHFSSLKRTPLYELHKELGGRMVDFAGYELPVQYKDGIVKSHVHTREKGNASVFDVSHMGQLKIEGKDRIAFLESVVVGDLQGLGVGQGRLSLITNDSGGIIDDCVITVYDDHVYVVVNAGNKDIDLEHMTSHLKNFSGEATISKLKDRALVALQGDGSVATMKELFPTLDTSAQNFMSGTYFDVNNSKLIITRCGYTGEDGFEISVPATDATALVKKMLDLPNAQPAGLGARDSLRLEAGLCLHGHDITANTTPVEAALSWTIGKRRRSEANFPGANIILNQIKNKANDRKRVGFTMPSGNPPAREGAEIFLDDGETKVGKVTSGTLSPMLKHPVGMAYMNRGHFKVGKQFQVKVRNKFYELTLAKMPFVPSNYFSAS